jgi:hypothetical protein
MTYYWFIFSGCALCAWLVGYGMGYLRGGKDAITANALDGDLSFSGNASDAEI